jgi:lauroyl/myristoyl acyltransferase
MNLITFLNSRLGPWLGIVLGRVLNQRQAYALADWVSGKAANLRSAKLMQGLRANQAVVRGLDFDDPKLDGIVREVLRTAGRGYADWYLAMARGPEAVRESIDFEDSLLDRIKDALEDDQGIVLAGAHMSSFNLLLLKLGVLGLPIQALAYARPRGAVHVDNAVRLKFGVDLTPISVRALREAFRRLRAGGAVMTAVDRPDVGGDILTFFNRPARLPVGHARLALRTGARVLIGVTETIGPGKYFVKGSPFVEPERTGDEEKDIRLLAQQVLSWLERYIREKPSDWLVYLPVWPNVIPSPAE